MHVSIVRTSVTYTPPGCPSFQTRFQTARRLTPPPPTPHPRAGQMSYPPCAAPSTASRALISRDRAGSPTPLPLASKPLTAPPPSKHLKVGGCGQLSHECHMTLRPVCVPTLYPPAAGNVPGAVQNHLHPHFRRSEGAWLAVTRASRDVADDSALATVSSWGRVSLSMHTLWLARPAGRASTGTE